MDGTILIYGATGYTGKLIARAAGSCGVRPVLAGLPPPLEQGVLPLLRPGRWVRQAQGNGQGERAWSPGAALNGERASHGMDAFLDAEQAEPRGFFRG